MLDQKFALAACLLLNTPVFATSGRKPLDLSDLLVGLDDGVYQAVPDARFAPHRLKRLYAVV
jgi:hypothetical protein